VVKNWQNSTDEPISFESTYVFLFKGANETVPSSEIMSPEGFGKVEGWDGITALHLCFDLELFFISPE
jgi:hypothetical protein